MIGNNGKTMGFSTDPFYLYPIREDMLGTLFIDREEEVAIASGLLDMRYEDNTEICVILGGIGVGKSSFLHYLAYMGKNGGYSVEFHSSPWDFDPDRRSSKREKHMILIDDVAKLDEEGVRRFLSGIEKQSENKNHMVFFSDTYDRSKESIKQRSFTVSQSISLPRGMNQDKLKYFLEERIRRCLSPGEEYFFPFSDEALAMAATRSNGNLRSFLNYAKNGWMIATSSASDMVGWQEMRSGMIIIDRALLGNFDLIDMKILWHSTIGDINKSYLAHQCSIDPKTLDSRINDKLSDIVFQNRSGKEMMVASVYRHIQSGRDILERTLEGLGVNMDDLIGK